MVHAALNEHNEQARGALKFKLQPPPLHTELSTCFPPFFSTTGARRGHVVVKIRCWGVQVGGNAGLWNRSLCFSHGLKAGTMLEVWSPFPVTPFRGPG